MKKINRLIHGIRPKRYLVLLLGLMVLVACSDSDPTTAVSDPVPAVEDPDFPTPDWTALSHDNGTEPNYAEVFNDAEVKRMDIVLSNENWQAMLDDMAAKYGFGNSRPGGSLSSSENPIWVPASVFWEGVEWYAVGLRFKGNSSLSTAWSRGIMKLPLKLDFDEFEDDYPQIENQRFFGFKQLSLSNGFEDASLIREKMAADIFRAAGVTSAHTVFCRVYIDYGDGPIYFGLYTIVEVIDDTVIENQYTDDSGNLYKPEGDGASFAAGRFDTSDFEKKSNEEEGDWSDVTALYDALHSSTRTTDPESWRVGLEAVLDVDQFLNWLAVNTVIQNWDTYGRMTHNYYLYGDPTTGLLNWIPWDNNEALQEGKQGGAVSLDFRDVSDSWPLISFLYDDVVYRARYLELIEDLVEGVFSPERMVPIYEAASTLIEPYVIGDNGETNGYTFLSSSGSFSAATEYLIEHVSERQAAVLSLVGN